MNTGETLLELTDIHKTFRTGPAEIQVLCGASLRVGKGEFVALTGSSGSGKSTLLHIAGMLETCNSGAVVFGGELVSGLSRSRRHLLRNRSFGFVFQLYHLLPELNVLENVLLPAMVGAPWYSAILRARPRKTEALELLGELGLSKRLSHRPAELSGGERQRVAIARALINDPAVLLADEPTGNLDPRTGQAIMDLLGRLHEQRNQSILLVTHDAAVANRADRIVRLADGKVEPVQAT